MDKNKICPVGYKCLECGQTDNCQYDISYSETVSSNSIDRTVVKERKKDYLLTPRQLRNKRERESIKGKAKQKRYSQSPKGREMHRKAMEKYNNANREKKNAEGKLYYAERRSEISAKKKIYYAEHRLEILAKIKAKG